MLNEAQEPIGVVTDRDLVVKAMAQGSGPFDATVGEIMTPNPRTVYEGTPIEEALRLMRSGAFRRAPVVDRDGKLVGLVSLDDILDLLAEEFRDIGGLLRKESSKALAET